MGLNKKKRKHNDYDSPSVAPSTIKKALYSQERKLRDEVANTQCAICQDNTLTNPASLTPCKHTFCRMCIEEWFKTAIAANKCPCCRQLVESVLEPYGIIDGELAWRESDIIILQERDECDMSDDDSEIIAENYPGFEDVFQDEYEDCEEMVFMSTRDEPSSLEWERREAHALRIRRRNRRERREREQSFFDRTDSFRQVIGEIREMVRKKRSLEIEHSIGCNGDRITQAIHMQMNEAESKPIYCNKIRDAYEDASSTERKALLSRPHSRNAKLLLARQKKKTNLGISSNTTTSTSASLASSSTVLSSSHLNVLKQSIASTKSNSISILNVIPPVSCNKGSDVEISSHASSSDSNSDDDLEVIPPASKIEIAQVYSTDENEIIRDVMNLTDDKRSGDNPSPRANNITCVKLDDDAKSTGTLVDTDEDNLYSPVIKIRQSTVEDTLLAYL